MLKLVPGLSAFVVLVLISYVPSVIFDDFWDVLETGRFAVILKSCSAARRTTDLSGSKDSKFTAFTPKISFNTQNISEKYIWPDQN